MEDITRDAIEAAGREHVLSVALEERIKMRWGYRRWYRANRAVLSHPSWRSDELLNAAALVELLALRRMVKRASR
jgi:hypothetical protein